MHNVWLFGCCAAAITDRLMECVLEMAAGACAPRHLAHLIRISFTLFNSSSTRPPFGFRDLGLTLGAVRRLWTVALGRRRPVLPVRGQPPGQEPQPPDGGLPEDPEVEGGHREQEEEDVHLEELDEGQVLEKAGRREVVNFYLHFYVRGSLLHSFFCSSRL